MTIMVNWRYFAEDQEQETSVRRITDFVTTVKYKLRDEEVHEPTLN